MDDLSHPGSGRRHARHAPPRRLPLLRRLSAHRRRRARCLSHHQRVLARHRRLQRGADLRAVEEGSGARRGVRHRRPDRHRRSPARGQPGLHRLAGGLAGRRFLRRQSRHRIFPELARRLHRFRQLEPAAGLGARQHQVARHQPSRPDAGRQHRAGSSLWRAAAVESEAGPDSAGRLHQRRLSTHAIRTGMLAKLLRSAEAASGGRARADRQQRLAHAAGLLRRRPPVRRARHRRQRPRRAAGRHRLLRDPAVRAPRLGDRHRRERGQDRRGRQQRHLPGDRGVARRTRHHRVHARRRRLLPVSRVHLPRSQRPSGAGAHRCRGQRAG